MRFGFGYTFGGNGSGGITPIVWSQATNMDVTNNGYLIGANGGANGSWDRNPYSQQIGSNRVFDVSFTLGSGDLMVGVCPVANIANSFIDLDYCFCASGANIYVVQNGSTVTAAIGSDRTKTCRIVGDGTDCLMYFDGALVYTFTPIPNTNYHLKISSFNNTSVTDTQFISI